MRYFIFVFAISATSLFNLPGHAPAFAPVVVEPQVSEPFANGAEEITIDYTGFPAGTTRLLLVIGENRDASFVQWKGQRVKLSSIVSGIPDDDDDPPPVETVLDRVRAVFVASDELDVFELHVQRLKDGLTVPPGADLEKVHVYINLELAKILGDYAEPQWLPWTDALMDKLTAPGIDLPAYTKIIDDARGQL